MECYTSIILQILLQNEDPEKRKQILSFIQMKINNKYY